MTRLDMGNGVVWQITADGADLEVGPDAAMELRTQSAQRFVRRVNRRWASGECWTKPLSTEPLRGSAA